MSRGHRARPGHRAASRVLAGGALRGPGDRRDGAVRRAGIDAGHSAGRRRTPAVAPRCRGGRVRPCRVGAATRGRPPWHDRRPGRVDGAAGRGVRRARGRVPGAGRGRRPADEGSGARHADRRRRRGRTCSPCRRPPRRPRPRHGGRGDRPGRRRPRPCAHRARGEHRARVRPGRRAPRPAAETPARQTALGALAAAAAALLLACGAIDHLRRRSAPAAPAAPAAAPGLGGEPA